MNVFYDVVKKIDAVLVSKSTKQEKLEILKILGGNISYGKYFFNRVSSAEWFYPLEERKCFEPEKILKLSPETLDVLPYLEKISQRVSVPGNEKYIDELLLIIKKTTKHYIENDKILDNNYTWWYFVKVLCNLPTEKIDNTIINLIPTWFESKFDNILLASDMTKKFLPKFLDSNNSDDWKKAEKIVDIVTQIKLIPKHNEQEKKEIEEKYKDILNKPKKQRTEEEELRIAVLDLEGIEPKTVIDDYWLVDSFIKNKIADKVGGKCSEKVIYNLADKIKKIFQKKYKLDNKNKEGYDLSYIWFRSMFGGSEHVFHAEETLALILRNILLSKAKKDEKTTRTILQKFLEEKYPIFKRLVLFIIGMEWDTYKNVFWDMLAKDRKGNFFNDSHYEAEIYTILQKHVSKFSPKEKEKIKDIIEIKVPKKPHPKDEYKEFYSAYQKQKWYSAVNSDNYFKSLYEKYKNITKKEEEIRFKEPTVRTGPGPSPLTKEKILEMPNKELAEYLKTFKTVDFWKGPTINGLSEILKGAVQENPEKFVDNLQPFLKSDYLHVYHILEGIRNGWENKKIFDWEKVFNFIQEYIKPKDFWDDKHFIKDDHWKANHLWILGIIGELIRGGTTDDAWAFSEKHFKTAQETLSQTLGGMLSEKEKILKEHPAGDDFISHLLNSAFGKITEAFFMLALRIKRVEEKSKTKQEVSWNTNIKDNYEKLLSEEIVDGYTLFGRYLPNFYYLDKEWTKNKIDTITIEKNKILWEAFLSGCLSGRFYDDLYELMRKHYEKAIDYQFKREYSSERLVQHICIGYLRKFEKISEKDSLFKKLLDKWDTSQIREIIGFFWMQRDYKEEEKDFADRIIEFWERIYENKYKGKQEKELNKEDKTILSKLSNLAVFLPEIDSENVEWLKKSALFVNVDFHSTFFVEYLNKLKDKGQSINFIGDLYLEMLKNATPTFREEDIYQTIEYLYEKGKKEDADTICNIYGSRGLEFLRKLYEKYNRNPSHD